MTFLQPIYFKVKHANNLKWSTLSENLSLFFHIRNCCESFPSLILAYSSATCMHEVASEVAEGFLSIGINIFLPKEPSPIAALSQSVAARGMPIGLYLDWSEEKQMCSLSALNMHGGPIDKKDVCESSPTKIDKIGVIGQAKLDSHYINRLAELADPFLEPGKGFSNLITPFPNIMELLKKNSKLKHLLERDPSGPIAKISPDGQILTISEQNGKEYEVADLVSKIGIYLSKERMASGSILGPLDLTELSCIGNFIKSNNGSFDMSYRAGFENLLLGWTETGVIAHQGSSCFGDAFLSALYLIEAWRC